jgi:hypothetical protein
MYTGPKLINDDLVFGYDTGYGVADTAVPTRFYKGKPTVNMLTSGDNFANWNKTQNSGNPPTITSDVAPGPFTGTLADRMSIPTGGSYPRIYQYYTPASTATHTFSVWLKAESAGQSVFVGAFRNSPWALPSSTSFTITDEWVNYSLAINPQDTTSMQLYIGSHDAHKGKEFLIYGAQIEASSDKSPFVDGTRSATGSLIDLKRTTSIDVSNVSLNSTGQPTFDGTNDYISKTRRQYTTEPWSVETIFKPTDANDTSWNGLFGGNLGAGGYWFFHSAGNLGLYSSAGYITYRSWTKANTFIVDKFHHLTITYTPATTTTGTFNLYYNGGEKTMSFSFTFANTYTLDSQYIGMGGGNRYGTNDVAVYKEYGKVLSADEVQQNYNAYKNRFNL